MGLIDGRIVQDVDGVRITDKIAQLAELINQSSSDIDAGLFTDTTTEIKIDGGSF